MNGTEGLIYYHVWEADFLTAEDVERSMATVDALLLEDGRDDTGDAEGELWASTGRFMVCLALEGDTRHLKHDGWTRIV